MKVFFLQKKILKCIYSFFVLSFLLCPVFAMNSTRGLDGFVEAPIDASKNARLHSNMGNIYFSEKNYIDALKEYEIAFNLAYNTQASGAYLYNIARCHYALNNYLTAKNAVLGAIKKDCINITYYQLLVDCYIKLGTVEKELKSHIKQTDNPYNRVIVGLIYLKTNRKMQAKATFDDFIATHPDMIISEDIKTILNKI